VAISQRKIDQTQASKASPFRLNQAHKRKAQMEAGGLGVIGSNATVKNIKD